MNDTYCSSRYSASNSDQRNGVGQACLCWSCNLSHKIHRCKTVDLQVCSPPVDPQLGSTVSFVVKTSDTFVDGRSGEPVYLSTKDLQVVVKYGKSQKQLLVSQSKGHNGSYFSVGMWW